MTLIDPMNRPAVGALLKCLICCEEKPWGLIHEPSGVVVCVDCRDAANRALLCLSGGPRSEGGAGDGRH